MNPMPAASKPEATWHPRPLLEVLHPLRVLLRSNRDDAFARTPLRLLLAGIPKMKLNTGTFASSKTRA